MIPYRIIERMNPEEIRTYIQRLQDLYIKMDVIIAKQERSIEKYLDIMRLRELCFEMIADKDIMQSGLDNFVDDIYKKYEKFDEAQKHYSCKCTSKTEQAIPAEKPKGTIKWTTEDPGELNALMTTPDGKRYKLDRDGQGWTPVRGFEDDTD